MTNLEYLRTLNSDEMENFLYQYYMNAWRHGNYAFICITCTKEWLDSETKFLNKEDVKNG